MEPTMVGKDAKAEIARLRSELKALDTATSVHGGPPLPWHQMRAAQNAKAEILRQIAEIELKLAK
jgi:hypothetical protein